MPVKAVLGRYEYNINTTEGELSVEKIKLLYKLGITRADISNYRHNRLKYISKKHLLLIEKMKAALLLNSKQFKPFAVNKQKEKSIYLVQRGINDLSKVQKRL